MSAYSAAVDALNRRKFRTVEETSLALLALRKLTPPLTPLSQSQLPTGAWTNDSIVASPNAYVTSLALLALAASPSAAGKQPDKALAWLNRLRPKESEWLQRWKFSRLQNQLRWDPNKFGWPWVPGTISWVPPTALVILAHRAWNRSGERVQNAEMMLMDRACVQGGWNYGNSTVFGHNLDPHPDYTAMALLALRDSSWREDAAIAKAVDYLGKRLASSASLYSLSWALMALAAYDSPKAGLLRQRLERALDRNLDAVPPAVLALSALALEERPFSFRRVSS